MLQPQVDLPRPPSHYILRTSFRKRGLRLPSELSGTLYTQRAVLLSNHSKIPLDLILKPTKSINCRVYTLGQCIK